MGAALLFTVTHDELSGIVGAASVHVLTDEDADRFGFHGQAREFLTTVGIPETDEFSFGFPEGYSPKHLLRADDLVPLGWKITSQVDGWIRLGYFPLNMVAVNPEDGTVHQFTEGSMRVSLIHSDLSSLVRTVADTVAFLRQYVEADDEDEAYEERRAALEVIKKKIASRDPAPFGNSESQWIEIFEDIEAGSWT
jgi:hypothetical protein